MKGTLLQGLWQPQQAPFISSSLPGVSNHIKSCNQVRQQHSSSHTFRRLCRDTQYLRSSDFYPRSNGDERTSNQRRNTAKDNQPSAVLTVRSNSAFQQSHKERGTFYSGGRKSTRTELESNFTSSFVDETANQYPSSSGSVYRRASSPILDSSSLLAVVKTPLDSAKSSSLQTLPRPLKGSSSAPASEPHQIVSRSTSFKKPAEAERTFLVADQHTLRISQNAAHQPMNVADQHMLKVPRNGHLAVKSAGRPTHNVSESAPHLPLKAGMESVSEQTVSNSRSVVTVVSRANPSVMSADQSMRSYQGGANVPAPSYRGPQSNMKQLYSRSVVKSIPSIVQEMYTANQRRVQQEINEFREQWKVQKTTPEFALRRADQSPDVVYARKPERSLSFHDPRQGNQAVQLESSAPRIPMMTPNFPSRREVQSIGVVDSRKYDGPPSLHGTVQGRQGAQVPSFPPSLHGTMAQVQRSRPDFHGAGQGSQMAQVQPSLPDFHGPMQGSQMAQVQRSRPDFHGAGQGSQMAQVQPSRPDFHGTMEVSQVAQVQTSSPKLLGTVQVSQQAQVQTSPQSVVIGAHRWREAAKIIEDKRKPVFVASQAEAESLSIELEPVHGCDSRPEESGTVLQHQKLSGENDANLGVTLESDWNRGAENQDLVSNQEAELDAIAASVEAEIESPPTGEVRWKNVEVMVVNDVTTAKAVVEKLRGEYKDFIHACDTEVAEIDVKKESPVGHGRMICFSIYCGPNTNFGGGKCRLWVDVLGKEEVLDVFKSYFEDPDIKKVWHNYSFDRHILGNHGIKARGFYADTMHLARLYDSSRSTTQGGYSLEGLTSDRNLMRGYWGELKMEEVSLGKLSMKHLFGKPNIKKNGEDGKLLVVPPVEELQTKPESRDKWIHYSCFDTVCTWCLWKSLHDKLMTKEWMIEGKFRQEGQFMYNFYEKYVKPFGELLVQMEAEGMLLDREHLAKIEEIALKQQEFSSNQFKKWAAKRCPDAIYMNVGSDAQIRQLLFGGKENKNDSANRLPLERTFKAPNTDNYLEDGKKVPKKTRPFTLHGLGVDIPVDSYTSAGWPTVGGASLKTLAGKVAIDYTVLDKDNVEDVAFGDLGSAVLTSTGVKGGSDDDLSVYGSAYQAFGGGQEGREACMAFAALCEVASINTLISNFIQPLQGSDIKGPDGRIHCSLNINTETGRLSARRPSLQNQPALEKDRYKIRQAFVASPGNSLIVADYGQLELRILAHLTDCKSMLKAFVDGGDFHSRTAMNMYPHVQKAVENGDVILEWEAKPGEEKPPVPLLKDVFGAERRKAKMLNFSIAYGKTAMGLSKDWKVSLAEAKATVELWYSDRPEVRRWQEQRIKEAHDTKYVHTLLGRTRHFPDVKSNSMYIRGHIERAAINTPVQGSAADVAMCAMLEISDNKQLQDLGWRLLLQVHDEVILEGPAKSADLARDTVVKCMGFPFAGQNNLRVALAVDAKYAQSWYAAK